MRRSAAWAAALACLACPIAPAQAKHTNAPYENELVVLDPGVNSLKRPGVRLEPGPDGVQVDIPPVVHVHRFYYSGDKEYQGPILSGGPTVIVANHPKTGQRLYVNVMLPPGAPAIAYSKSSITYAYPDQRVEICYGWWHTDQATVKYLAGRGFARNFHDCKARTQSWFKECWQSSRFGGAVRDTARNTHDGLVGLGGLFCSAGAVAIETSCKIISVVPGVQTLESLGRQRAERSNESAVTEAGKRLEQQELKFLPTNR